MITTVAAFLLTLGVLVVVHEYGHYRVAVARGVKVLRLSKNQFADLGQCQAPGGPLDQAGAQVVFQPGQLARQN